MVGSRYEIFDGMVSLRIEMEVIETKGSIQHFRFVRQ